ncbi:MAG: hypothetical protein DRJ44_01970 [Thermoprotei archaeon]|nr:MAG: hypothetical protein DRJ44_01970 [Thermoprotei archaeon]
MSVVLEKKLLEEIQAVRATIERIEALLEERLIGVEEALPDEIETIKEYMSDKEKERIELVSLERAFEESEKHNEI